jgi:prepilin-type N-terminal cleavage/methylation domain-containing protein
MTQQTKAIGIGQWAVGERLQGWQSPDRQFAKSANQRARGFSLVEVLLAIFILGVGVISIASLFPAGIAQQRLSVDDIMGPTVANNAIAIIRSKVRPEDFAYFIPTTGAHPTVQGDSRWARPAFYGLGDGVAPSEASINLFIDADCDTELQYNTDIWTSGAPDIQFTMGERYYPMMPLKNRGDASQGFANSVDGRPQYVWTPMFRRFQGKVLVAIFVYRVNSSNAANYKPSEDQYDPNLPPLPHAYVLQGNGTHPGGPWQAGNSVVMGTTAAGQPFVPNDQNQAWQDARQWIIDENNNIYRVANSFRGTMNPVKNTENVADPLLVEFVRPVPAMANGMKSFVYPANGAVERIWYIPLVDTNGVSLTPVYATVKEL